MFRASLSVYNEACDTSLLIAISKPFRSLVIIRNHGTIIAVIHQYQSSFAHMPTHSPSSRQQPLSTVKWFKMLHHSALCLAASCAWLIPVCRHFLSSPLSYFLQTRNVVLLLFSASRSSTVLNVVCPLLQFTSYPESCFILPLSRLPLRSCH